MKLQLGGHVPAKEGLRYVISTARAMNYNVVQTMVGGGADYQPYDIPLTVALEYKKLIYGIETYVHLPYILNPCEGKPQRRGWGGRVFQEFCRTAQMIGAKAVVIHPGYKKQLELGEAQENCRKFFERYFEEDWEMDILLETDAGSKNGSAIGSLQFIKEVLEQLDHFRFGMCLDTEHLYARGIDLWDHDIRKRVLKDHGEQIRLIHLNVPDPEVDLGSNRDRHNSPFSSREWAHEPLIRDLESWPLILERRSLVVQEEDAAFVRLILDPK